MIKRMSGLSEFLSEIDRMDLENLLAMIDAHYGRSYLEYGATIDDVREEARSQARENYTDYREATTAEMTRSKYRRTTEAR